MCKINDNGTMHLSMGAITEVVSIKLKLNLINNKQLCKSLCHGGECNMQNPSKLWIKSNSTRDSLGQVGDHL